MGVIFQEQLGYLLKNRVPKTILVLKLEVSVDQREGYFAASTKPFAITAYGKSIKKAHKRALLAVKLLFDGYSNGSNGLSDFLNHRDIEYTLRTTE